MENLKSRITLLDLFSIVFIYKVIGGIISNNLNEITLWTMITFVYIFSLVVAFFVMKKFKKEHDTIELH